MDFIRGLFKALIFCLFLGSPIAGANDAAIGLDGGELFFKKQKGVVMKKERLYLSPTEVKVAYEFENITDKKIETKVGFPIKWDENCGDKNFDSNSDNPLGFTVRVNGKKKKFKIKKELGDPENCEEESKITYYWNQKFPVGKTVKIQHSYNPVYEFGVMEMAAGGSLEDWKKIRSQQLKEDFCASASQVKSIEKKRPRVQILNYILQSANTWEGPIGDFEMVIDKAGSLRIFLCTDLELKRGKKKGQFVARKKNFRPQKDLRLAFVGAN